MRSVGAGVVVEEGHKGYLDLTPEALDALISREPITAHYHVEHTPFARGKFAAVRRARCLRSGTWFAAKVMRKRRRAQDVRHEILHEAAVLLLARPAPRIVSLHRLYETTSEIILVLELAEGGELQRVIDEEESLAEEVARRYMTNILAALRFLHSYNIAHLDLKPQNLLLMGQHPDSEVKLCDFGISRIILSDIEVREVLGTPDYVAPEILQYEPISLATDMWSVGVLVYVLLTGHSPFGGDTKQETFLNISQGQVDFPEDLFCHVSHQAIHFITQLLLVDPGSRLTVDEALQHPWVSGTRSLSRPLPSPTPATTPAHSPEAPSHTHTKDLDLQHALTNNGIPSYHCSNTSANQDPSVQPIPVTSPTSPTPATCTKDTIGHGSWVTVRQVREQDLYAPSTSSFHATRETDTSREGCSSPWKPSKLINKENNKNTINKTEEVLLTSKELASHETPSKSKSRLAQTEKAKREMEKVKREVEMVKNIANNKEGKENKENGKDGKESVKEKLKPSPLCLRRQGSKCDLKSPSEQQKYGAGTVSIILEKSIIC